MESKVTNNRHSDFVYKNARKCTVCKNIFRGRHISNYEKNRRELYCTTECRSKAGWSKNHRSKNVPKIKCIKCGKYIEHKIISKLTKEQRKTRKYCSRVCAGFKPYSKRASQKMSYSGIRSSNMARKHKRVLKKCKHCGKEFNATDEKSRRKSHNPHKFCSKVCMEFRYPLVEQAKFWRYNFPECSMTNAEDIPNDMVPHGIMKPWSFANHKHTEKEIEEFREWNNSNSYHREQLNRGRGFEFTGSFK